jgi:hypothetical protein
MMPGDEINRRTACPHFGQAESGSSFMLCLASNLLEQLSH